MTQITIDATLAAQLANLTGEAHLCGSDRPSSLPGGSRLDLSRPRKN
jgi:hypothetical protein